MSMCIPMAPCRIDLPYPSELKIHCGALEEWVGRQDIIDKARTAQKGPSRSSQRMEEMHFLDLGGFPAPNLTTLTDVKKFLNCRHTNEVKYVAFGIHFCVGFWVHASLGLSGATHVVGVH